MKNIVVTVANCPAKNKLTMQIVLHDIPFTLLAERAMYRTDTRTLILADMHLGKASHFRKAGISIPLASSHRDYEVFARLIQDLQPVAVYILGDLFHSDYNMEWEVFCEVIGQFPEVSFSLIMGNHDILARKRYECVNIKLIDSVLDEDGFLYSHEPLDDIPDEYINIAGHIHPGVRLESVAESIRLPCFFYYKNNFLLPAFGRLTGLQMMKPVKGGCIYAIAENKVIKV